MAMLSYVQVDIPSLFGRDMRKAGTNAYELVANGLSAEVWYAGPGPSPWKGSFNYEGKVVLAVSGVTARDAASFLEREARSLQRNLFRFLGPMV